MEVKTTSEITAITITSNNKEWANIKWIKLDDIKEELKTHLEHYKETNGSIANFINSFYYGLEIP